MKKAVVVGSGAGGAAAALELQGKYDVTVLEAGKPFRPFLTDLRFLERIRRTGLLFDERMISFLFPSMKIRKSAGSMILVNGVGTGGTTTICTANGVRHDEALKRMGINLDDEFDELIATIPISDDHRKHWNEATRRTFEVCRGMGLEPVATPKMAYRNRCAACGRCVFGCRRGAKWDSREFLNTAVENGAEVISGCRVRRVLITDGEAHGVEVSNSARPRFYPADLVVLAAGGLGTPVILRDSGIECEDRLFADPVLCVAAEWEGANQDKEIPMPFIIQKDHYIISPYFDFLSFFFNRSWRHAASNIYSLMIKLADSNIGRVSDSGIEKGLSASDREKFCEAMSLCREIFHKLGKQDDEMFLGTLNAGHPGGMLPLTARESKTFHNDSLPGNVYIADSTLFPESLGNPPILTIMAMAKRVGKICASMA